MAILPADYSPIECQKSDHCYRPLETSQIAMRRSILPQSSGMPIAPNIDRS
ncbi:MULTISPECIES: hypothetical protein [unclassified Chamaesiphon]|uniref:hypothetical protein n=1 Tax=unclassified Chamaesiphon TaxID=2620921 RepID=UPI00286B0D36|nr:MULTISPECIES: hypothetical protein [unclassified Chamaesiphon]